MTKHPKISILLPYYNAANTLHRALESLSTQTYSDFECLLIDNNSSDGGNEVAEAWSKRDPRFVYLSEKRQGIVQALNRGLENAKGKFVARMDADDWSFPERLQMQLDVFKTHSEIGVVAAKAIHVPYDKDNEGLKRYVEWSNSVLSSRDIFKKRFMESPVIHPTVMWRKSVSDQYGAYAQGNFPEDYELWLRWMSKGVQFYKVDEPLIKWYDAPTRLTRIDSRYSDQAFFEIKSKYLASYLTEINQHHPDVLVWGASKISRKRATLLERFGIHIRGYVDISRKRQLDDPVIHYEDLPHAPGAFILVYLKEETMRRETVDFLEQRGYVEDEHYLLVS